MTNETPGTVSPREAAEWLRTGEALLVDVREPDEFKAEHIGGALSVPLSLAGRLGDVIAVPAGRKVVFQCLSGMRAGQACVMAGSALPGRAAYNLEGGIEGWKAAGLPVVSAAGGTAPRAPSLFRQVQMIVGSLVFLMVLIGFLGWTPAFAIAGFFGFMLALAGLTGWCGLALMLSRMPWNRPA